MLLSQAAAISASLVMKEYSASIDVALVNDSRCEGLSQKSQPHLDRSCRDTRVLLARFCCVVAVLVVGEAKDDDRQENVA